MQPVSLQHALAGIDDLWSPRIVAALNGQHVKLARIHGDFPMHAHPQADELFLVLKGALRMEFEDDSVDVSEGQLIVVPRGVRHRPVAQEECHILLFEPEGTLNTGDAPTDARTTDGSWPA